MKRRALWVAFAFVATTMGVSRASAQLQRLAIPVGSFEIGGSGSRIVEAFCLDSNLDPPPAEGIDYSSIIAGGEAASVRLPSGERMSFAEAQQRGLIRTRGLETLDGFGLQFESPTKQRLKVEFKSPFVAAPEPRAHPSTLQLRELLKPDPDQLRIWAAAEHTGDLAAIGYDLGETSADAIAAIRRFQVEEHLKPDGLIGTETTAALRRRTEAIREELASAGYGSDALLDEQLRAAQKDATLPVTGRYAAELHDYLQKEAARITEIAGVLSENGPEGAAPSMRLRPSDKHPGVITFSSPGSDSPLLLTKENAQLQLWQAYGDGQLLRVKSKDPIAEFDRRNLQSVAESSTPEGIFIQAGLADSEKIPVAVGRRILNVDRGRFNDFIVGSSPKLKELDQLLSSFDADERLPLIVGRSPLLQGRGGDAEGPPLLNGRSLPDATALAGAIARSYADRVDVFLANDPALASVNITRLPAVRSASNVAVVSADGVVTFDTIDNVLPVLEKSGVRVIGAAGDELQVEENANVFVFPGHKDETYRAATLQLARTGRLKDSILALASCGDRGEEAFNTELIRTSGARAIIFYDKAINPQAVEDVLAEFARRLPRDGEPVDFMRIWHESVEGAATRNPQNKEMILQLKSALPQLSMLKLAIATEAA
jgi:hypothetical protein